MSTITFTYYAAHAVSVAVLATAFVFAFFLTDDLLFDAAFWWTYIQRATGVRKPAVTLDDLFDASQQRIAIFVPCWHEHDVIDRMVQYAAKQIRYDRFDILVGVYPNDEATVEAVRRAGRAHPNVHAVINDKPGPTTKAQNLNCVYRAMKQLEGDDPFRIIVLHDTEDIIHPLSMRLYNALIPASDMVQIPVFPLERPWYELIAWTYADEFSKNHSKDMLLRQRLGAFVPSAGVGTAIAREALESVAASSHDLFPEGALTEDYQFALRLHERGFNTTFVNERLSPQRRGRPATAAAYVATREYFPDTLAAAVRQKSRWVAGICLQSWSEIGWTGNWATRYALYRDRKGLAANLAAFFGYLVLAAAVPLYVYHAFVPQAFVPAIGNEAWKWTLLEFVLAGTLVQVVQTACFVSWVYGPLEGLLSIPRTPLATVINGLASIRAVYTFAEAKIKRRPLRWAKTEHVFPTTATLDEFSQSVTREAGVTEEQPAQTVRAGKHSSR
jgi:adsorption protein B